MLWAAGVQLAIGSDSWEHTPTLPFNAAAAAGAPASGVLAATAWSAVIVALGLVAYRASRSSVRDLV